MFEDNEMHEEEEIWSKIKALKLSPKPGEHSPKSDRMYCLKLEEGLKEDNLDKIYQFIEATERGCGILPQKEINDLIREAFEKDSTKLCDILATEKSLLEQWYILSSACSLDMIANFVLQDVVNALFYYECARLLFKKLKYRSDNIEKIEEIIKTAILKFANYDMLLWERWIRKNEHFSEWHRLLNSIIGKLNRQSLSVYADSIDLELSPNDKSLESVSLVFRNKTEDELDVIFDSIGEIIVKRWEKIIKEEKKNQMDILVTAYTDVIIKSLYYYLKKHGRWKTYFLEWVYRLEECEYLWYQSVTDKNKVFIYNFTHLYYILEIWIQEGRTTEEKEIILALQNLKRIFDSKEDIWKYSKYPEVVERAKEILDRIS